MNLVLLSLVHLYLCHLSLNGVLFVAIAVFLLLFRQLDLILYSVISKIMLCV